MEIPQEVQDKLKCSECDEFLSCGPVYLLHETGGTICGRCSQQTEPNHSKKNNNKSRIGPYEATASLLVFPCAYTAHGCLEKVSFSLGHPPHELSCEFRPFICLVAPRGSCDWIGSWINLKQHCEEKHPENIFENPCNPHRPDLSVSNLQTYVISAFHFLFLLHVKVCVTSGKLFHSLRMFGNQEMLDKLSYTFKIEGNDAKYLKKGSVLPLELMMLQEPTAIGSFINGLLCILDGKYSQSKVTFTIQITIRNCLNCLKNIKDVSDSEFCCECQGRLVKCKFNQNGCLFVDPNQNTCLKHETYFCKYQKKCFLNDCGVNFVAGSLIEHLASSTSCRKTKKANIDSVVRVTRNNSSYWNYILFSSNHFGTVLCSYYLSDSNFQLRLITSLPSFELMNYKCLIKLTDPQRKHSQNITPEIQLKSYCDWSIYVNIDNFPSWENIGIDINIIMYKNVNE